MARFAARSCARTETTLTVNALIQGRLVSGPQGKTGTINDNKAVWFVGYTPRLVTGVWIGFDQPQPIMSGGYAAEVAVPEFSEVASRPIV